MRVRTDAAVQQQFNSLLPVLDDLKDFKGKEEETSRGQQTD